MERIALERRDECLVRFLAVRLVGALVAQCVKGCKEAGLVKCLGIDDVAPAEAIEERCCRSLGSPAVGRPNAPDAATLARTGTGLEEIQVVAAVDPSGRTQQTLADAGLTQPVQ
jgi:hypothetical protein